VGKGLWLEQVKAGGLVLAGSCVITVLLYHITNALVGCRADADAETQGLDLAEHGEPGYDH
jgi:Amt family ammonium transporter